MAKGTSRTIRSRHAKKARAGLSDQTKKILAISSGSTVLIVGAVWAWFTFTTVPPPDLNNPDAPGKVEEVVDFLGMSRGLGAMSTTRQEQFLYSTHEALSKNPETRAQFVRAMNQMSTGEREVLNNAIFEIGRTHVMKSAREYASIAPSQRSRFIDNAYNKFEQLRNDLSGKSAKVAGAGVRTPGDALNLSSSLDKDLPQGSDELMKVLVDKTSPRERAEAKPFIDAMATKHKEKQAQRRK